MRGRKTWSLAAAALLLAALCAIAVVEAECPNGCSGNGDCMPKDKCDCYKNYQGNDCADRTCLFGRAHVDTPKGDIDMDKSRMTPGWILEGSQQAPAKTYEYFDPTALENEAHFYMECSNKGICDRATGLCQCFDGYEGNGCQRTTCPGKCNGHGTCESIRELASKHGGTLFGREGSVGAVNYDLWDANSTYGCRCDPWFFGPDCNKRNCKVGVDPLYLSAGKPRYETFIVHAYVTTTTDLDDAWYRLRVFDYFGESYITKKITMVDETIPTVPALAGGATQAQIDAHDAAVAAANAVGAAAVAKNVKSVVDAIKGVPNLTFGKIKCESTGAGTELEGFTSVLPGGRDPTLGTSITCQYTGNPGKMRIPEIAAASSVVTTKSVVTTSMQGEDEDWFTYKSIYTAAGVSGTTVTLVSSTPPQATPADLAGKLIKIGPHIVRVASVAGTGVAGQTTPTVVAADPYILTLSYALNHAVGTNVAIYTADPYTAVTADDTGVAAQTLALAIGKDEMKFAAAAPGLVTGDLIFFENAFFNIQEVTLRSSVYYARLDKPFGGTAAAGAAAGATAKPFKVTRADALKPYQYVSECSGRGMCGYDTGICTCFKGYTNDNCDRQNILAV